MNPTIVYKIALCLVVVSAEIQGHVALVEDMAECLPFSTKLVCC